MVDHVSLEIPQRVEDLPAFVTRDLLFLAMLVVDVVAKTRVAVEAFLTVWAFVLSFTVVDIAWTTEISLQFQSSRK